ncbi:MAG: hypothetical protein Ct9H300mP15_08060 [Gemmatimonadota bacterium]|nr:MAG: hypothetical protein Ct9H300mP15_08060 [Gemmatimonadota bacterium]
MGFLSVVPGELRDSQFLIVGVDVDSELPSGCSIDSLVNRLRTLGSGIGISLIDHTPVWYREGADIQSVSRSQFRALARSWNSHFGNQSV